MEYFVNFFQLFLLVFVRMFAILLTAPVYSSSVIPTRIKAITAFVISAVMFPLVADMNQSVPSALIPYVLTTANEAIIGLLLGFTISLIFSVFQMSAHFFSVQAGFGITETIDPLAQVSIPVLGQFLNLVATLVFIAIRGHHLVVFALYKSYTHLPILGSNTARVLIDKTPFLAEEIARFTGSMFLIALQIAFPIMGTLFLLSLSLGLIAKAAPQMNILILGFPFQVGLAMVTFIAIVPMLVKVIVEVIEGTFAEVYTFMGIMGGV